jgi:hypothetical protein
MGSVRHMHMLYNINTMHMLQPVCINIQYSESTVQFTLFKLTIWPLYMDIGASSDPIMWYL